MELIADGLLIAGALAAALYCWVLSRRVSALQDMDSGVGGAISELSRQVDEIRASLGEAKALTEGASQALEDKTARAEAASGRLEVLLASLHEADGAASSTADRIALDGRDGLSAPQAAEGGTPSFAALASGAAEGREGNREDVLQTLRSIVKGIRQ